MNLIDLPPDSPYSFEFCICLAMDVMESTESKFALAFMLARLQIPVDMTEANIAAPGALIRFLLQNRGKGTFHCTAEKRKQK